MNLKSCIFGNKVEKIPDMAFRIMSFFFVLKDIFLPVDERIDDFGLEDGFVVIDYGCGPGRYLKRASELVGENGIVYAVDVHELAIKSVKRKIKKHNLKNVVPVLVDGYSCDIKDHTADVIYALDMFHMVRDTTSFLEELHRLLKKDGVLIIEDSHQSRRGTKTKIKNSKVWNIAEEFKKYLKCTPE